MIGINVATYCFASQCRYVMCFLESVGERHSINSSSGRGYSQMQVDINRFISSHKLLFLKYRSCLSSCFRFCLSMQWLEQWECYSFN